MQQVLFAGGQCMPDCHCPTETLSEHGDIWPDQPDVPARIFVNGHPKAPSKLLLQSWPSVDARECAINQTSVLAADMYIQCLQRTSTFTKHVQVMYVGRCFIGTSRSPPMRTSDKNRSHNSLPVCVFVILLCLQALLMWVRVAF